MVSEPGHPGQPVYDRWFLLGEKRNQPLALCEVQQYGRDSFDDPDYVSVYGLTPPEWHASGVRILGRSAPRETSSSTSSNNAAHPARL